MVIRTKSGEFKAETKDVLLDFLGVKREAAGPQSVNADVELIASVPFRLTDDKEAAGFPWTLSTFDLDRYGGADRPGGVGLQAIHG
ncbi:MAG: hypothetical protein LBD37_02490 [Treponema sp.]|jgi:hypothetical protein|nr:hypothetical protein [Treponema sp.]